MTQKLMGAPIVVAMMALGCGSGSSTKCNTDSDCSGTEYCSISSNEGLQDSADDLPDGGGDSGSTSSQTFAGVCETRQTSSTGSSAASSGSGSGSGSDSGSSSSGSSSGSGDTGGPSCYGGFSLTSTPFSAAEANLGQACDDKTVPKNCADGTSITFSDTGECICIAMCSSAQKQVGENCSENFVCQAVESSDGNNKANVCVSPNWNLCGSGTGDGTTGSSGGDSGSSSGSSDSGSGDTSGSDGSSCKPAGSSCSEDEECCSETCGFDGCWG